jgi:hypothetical protein
MRLASSPDRGGKRIARGERSEPLVIMVMKRALEGRKAIFYRPSRALATANSYQGFALLTPGYFLPSLRLSKTGS